MLNQIKF